MISSNSSTASLYRCSSTVDSYGQKGVVNPQLISAIDVSIIQADATRLENTPRYKDVKYCGFIYDDIDINVADYIVQNSSTYTVVDVFNYTNIQHLLLK